MTRTSFDIYDIIFAGGGTAACLIAGRLAKADPSLKILVIEAGPHTYNEPMHYQPAMCTTHMTPQSKAVKFLVANPSDHLAGHAPVLVSAQCVGGGSSVNFMVYNRAAASDYDDWETKHNNPGWGSKDLIPLLRKTETFEINPESATHGQSGALHVSWGGIFTNIGKEFLNMAAKYDNERGSAEDVNDLFTSNAYGRWPKYISGKSGRRSDVPHHFFYTQRDNENLSVHAGHFVKRVIFDGQRATGVEYMPNPQIHPDKEQTLIVAHAKKLVVVSGGTLGSPLILERSGIGAASLLKKHGIKQVVDLPGVGERYQDHQIIVPLFCATSESDTLDAIIRDDKDEIEKLRKQWEKDGTGLMATNTVDAGIKYRPTDSQILAIGAAFEAKWKSFYSGVPDKSPVSFVTAAVPFGIENPSSKRHFSIAVHVNHPSSLGYIHIASGDDPKVHPEINPRFLENEADIQLLAWGYKRSREFARRMLCYRGEVLDKHPLFAKDSAAACREYNMPVDTDAPDLRYTEADDEAIRDYLRQNVGTCFHSLGTCAMMPQKDGGVVDSRLNVYGVTGLKVADLSIAPYNVGANTYSTALVIAEKAALIIAEDLGIKGV